MLSEYFIQSGIVGRRSLRRSLAGGVGLLLAGLSLTVQAAQQGAAPVSSSTFIIFVRGERLGSEDVTVARAGDGVTISSSGRIGPPIDLVIRELQVRYSPDW